MRRFGSLVVLTWLTLSAVAAEPEERPTPVPEAFSAAWSLLFGTDAPPPALLSRDSEGAFRASWEAAAGTLLPSERTAARDALRLTVLGDTAPLRLALGETLRAGRLLPADNEAVLWYAFLLEAGDPSALPEALPPGPGGERVFRAVKARGGDALALQTRFAAWVAGRAVDEGILNSEAAGLPAVWLLDRDLPPGGFTAWKLRVPDWSTAVRGESAGVGPLRLFTVFEGPERMPAVAGAGVPDRPILLPRRGGTLWLILWNPPSQEPVGVGATLTLWADLSAPFQIREARFFPGACDLLLAEMPGIAAYRLWGVAPAGGATAPLSPSFPSEGEGLHRYRIPLAGSPLGEHRFELRGLTWAGGTSTALLPKPGPLQP